MTEEEIKETYLYRYCLKKCKSEELKLSIASELKHAFEEYNGGDGFNWTTHLDLAFGWRSTPQGQNFWQAINNGAPPKGYQ